MYHAGGVWEMGEQGRLQYPSMQFLMQNVDLQEAMRAGLGLLAEKGYTGYLSYEAPNPEQWARSPYDVAREGVELTRKLLRDAVPSYVS